MWPPSSSRHGAARSLVVRLMLLSLAMLVAPIVSAATTTTYEETFDGVNAALLPANWVAQPVIGGACSSGTSAAWRTVTNSVDTAPNAAYAPDPNCINDIRLDSPNIPIRTTAAKLTFRSNFGLDAVGDTGYDGGVLEISIDGGTWQDIIGAGGSFVSGGYNKGIVTAYGNPIGGRQGWSGSSSGYVDTTVALPAAAGGTNVRLRWRVGTDEGVSGTGWRIDTVSISEPSSSPPVFTTNPIDKNITVTDGASGMVVSYATPVATDDVDGDLSVSCSPASGSTFPLGSTTVTCSASDSDGTAVYTSFIVKVGYAFTGFFQPVENDGVLNTAKAGSGIPVKFSLSGYQGMTLFASGFPASRQLNCQTGEPTDALEEYVPIDSKGLDYNASDDRYRFVWKTDKAWANGQCRTLILRFRDGTERAADFKFFK